MITPVISRSTAMTELYEAQKGLFPERETLTVEFKSDPKGGLKNDVVVDTAVGFANAEGGTLFIGLTSTSRTA